MPFVPRLVGNPAAIRKPTYVFWGDIAASDYTDLYNDRVNPGMTAMFGATWRSGTTDDVANRVSHWLRNYLDERYHYGGYTGDAYTTDYPDLAGNLAWHDAGNDGLCSYYSNTMLHVLSCLGIPCRRCSWYDPTHGGDEPVEYYSPELRQWVALSVHFGLRFRVAGALASVFQMHHNLATYTMDDDAAVNVHDPAKTWQPANGVATSPGSASFHAGYPTSVRWSINMGPSWDGGGFVQDADNPHDFGSQAENDASLVGWVGFDAFLIKLGTPTVSDGTLTIPIADSYAAWPATYHATAYDINGVALRSATPWTTGSGSIDTTDAYRVDVRALNSRGAWSNTVQVLGYPALVGLV